MLAHTPYLVPVKQLSLSAWIAELDGILGT